MITTPHLDRILAARNQSLQLFTAAKTAEEYIIRHQKMLARVAMLEDLLDRCRSVTYLPNELQAKIEAARIPRT